MTEYQYQLKDIQYGLGAAPDMQAIVYDGVRALLAIAERLERQNAILAELLETVVVLEERTEPIMERIENT